jgi:hypothetical protein
MTHQVALTICASVEPDRLDELRGLVDAMATDSAHSSPLPFADLPMTHFARLMMVERATDLGGTTLVLTMDCDAPAADRLEDLARIGGNGVDKLFGTCTAYPASPTPTTRLDYLRDHLEDSEVFYVHAVGRTLEQIRGEARLRQSVEDYLDRNADELSGQTPRRAREAVRGFVSGDPALAWALEPAPPTELSFRVREGIHKVAVPAGLLLAWPVVIPGLLLWVVALRVHETRDPDPDVELDPDRLRALGDAEDFSVQNAFTSLAPIKSGLFWGLTSRVSVRVASYFSRHIFTTGSLSGLTTVHFARFMRFGPDRAMLFTSYYDGSLESYNNDFVDQVAWVLNTVFGQQDGFPRTRWLVRDGAHNESGFKAFIRGHQIPNQVWYSAYPNLSAVTIDQNARLRAGLSGEPSAEEVEEWLRLL